MIGDCGELAPGEDDGVVEDSSDPYPTFPVDAPHIDFKDASTSLIVGPKSILTLCIYVEELFAH